MASYPLSPTKFKKTQPQGWVFCFLHPKEDENLRGQRFDPSEARERCASNGPQASHAVASYPLSPTKFKKAQPQGWVFCFLHLKEDENLRGQRFDPSEARERCASNGPQGESRSGESSEMMYPHNA